MNQSGPGPRAAIAAIDLWPSVLTLLERRDLLGARGLLDIRANNSGSNAALSRVLADVMTNYHGYLSQLGSDEIAPLDTLVPNTPSWRSIPPEVAGAVEKERRRLLDCIVKATADPRFRLAFIVHQLLYWVGLTDGLRVHYWLYRGVRALEMYAGVDQSLQTLRNHVRAELLAALELAPRSALAMKSEWTKSNYEGVEDFRLAVASNGIGQSDADVFLLRLDSVFRVGQIKVVI